MPANQAVALHPDFEYKVYAYERGHFLFAKGLKEKIEKDTGCVFQERKEIPSLKGRDLEGLHLAHPLYSTSSPVILSEFVNLESGTGCVHTAPGHGIDDYKLGFEIQVKK